MDLHRLLDAPLLLDERSAARLLLKMTRDGNLLGWRIRKTILLSLQTDDLCQSLPYELNPAAVTSIHWRAFLSALRRPRRHHSYRQQYARTRQCPIL